MKPETIHISGKECYVYFNPEASCLLIQPVDEHELEHMQKEVEMMEALTDKPFSFVAFRIENWNEELTPWAAPPAFGRVPFGDGARQTLTFVTDSLLPAVQGRGLDVSRCLLGGYSLAGLFALWAGYQCDRFRGIAAVSPSVWYPGWIEYVATRKAFAKAVYLSLGDKEERARNAVMAQVGKAIRRQHELLSAQTVDTILEWNPGNHFVDSEKRMAKGFAWTVNNTVNQRRDE